MKKKLLEMLDKRLTVDYVNRFLRGKGIATNGRGENGLMFKLYDINWDLFCKDGQFSMRSSFTLDDDIQMDCMVKAMNTLNNDRYVVKVFVDEIFPQDEEGNPITDAPVRKDITFSFENFCYNESAFEKLYEFAIYAMTDAIEYHQKLYRKYLTEHNTQTPKIGFHINVERQGGMPAAVNEQTKKRIGFV